MPDLISKTTFFHPFFLLLSWNELKKAFGINFDQLGRVGRACSFATFSSSRLWTWSWWHVVGKGISHQVCLSPMCSGAPGGMIRSKTSKCWMSFVERWGKKAEFLPLNFPRLWYNRSWADMGRSENTESASKLLVKLECQGVSDALMHCVKSVKNRRQPELSNGHWQASNQMATGLQGSYPAFRFTVSRFTRLPFFFFVCESLT